MKDKMGIEREKKAANYFNIEPKYSKLETAKFVILPAPYERTTSYMKGAANGPAAIKEASAEVELYEADVDCEPYLRGIYTAPPVKFGKSDDATELAKIKKAAEKYVDAGKFLITLGGEHTVSGPLVELFASRYKNLTVLHIDAHPDLRDSYEDNIYSHACVARRMLEHAPVVEVGVRAWCVDQQEFINSAKKKKLNGRPWLTMFPAAEIAGKSGWQKKVVDSLSENVYLTFDLDGLDPSIMPAVGTPEPGGLGWFETLDLLKELARRKNIVGADIVELMPTDTDSRGDFAAARLLHHILAYVVAFEKARP